MAGGLASAKSSTNACQKQGNVSEFEGKMLIQIDFSVPGGIQSVSIVVCPRMTGDFDAAGEMGAITSRNFRIR